ncbi:MAG: DNA repair exonuclease [Rhodospirillales bacterium]
MKFIHAADIHLDSPLTGLQARDDLPSDIVRDSTRRAFSGMIDLALAEDVAFVVIAGDLYDGDWKHFLTGLFFAEEMRRLARPCFLLRGNHDAQSLITRGLKLPANVREFSSRACETFRLPDLGVALHGHSFANRAAHEDLSAGYPAPVEGMFNIGVLHTSGDAPGEHAVYAPCTVADLTLKGYDYWALGHIHQRRVLSENPRIVFPGNLQGRHAKEIGAKGCELVTIEDRRIVAAEFRFVDVLRWAALDLDATGLDDAGLTAAIDAQVQKAVAEADERPILARLTVAGTTDLHGSLVADTERLIAECRNAAIGAGAQLWIEAVKIRTQPMPTTDTDSLSELRKAFFAGLSDPAIADKLRQEFDSLRKKVPARANAELLSDDDGLLRIAEDAWQLVASAIATTATR